MSNTFTEDETQALKNYLSELTTMNQSLEKLLKSVNQDQDFGM